MRMANLIFHEWIQTKVEGQHIVIIENFRFCLLPTTYFPIRPFHMIYNRLRKPEKVAKRVIRALNLRCFLKVCSREHI